MRITKTIAVALAGAALLCAAGCASTKGKTAEKDAAKTVETSKVETPTTDVNSSVATQPPEPDTELVPLTADLVKELGKDNLSKFHYYVSIPVKLQRENQEDHGYLFKDGVILRTDKNVHELINITPETPGAFGAVANPMIDYVNYQAFAIVFDADPDQKLYFYSTLAAPDRRYFLLYDDEVNHTVHYGDRDYTLAYQGEEQPCLMVRMSNKVLTQDQVKTATGRKLAE